MTDPYQGPVLTLKLQGRVNKNSVKINKIQIFDLIFYFIKSIIISLLNTVPYYVTERTVQLGDKGTCN